MAAQNYCFTINNWTAEHEALLAGLSPDLNPMVKYLLYGKEIAPLTLTPHLQGFLVFNPANKKSEKQVRKMLPGAHISVAKGSVDQNYDYCTKEGDYVEAGVKPMSQKEKGQANVERWAVAKSLAEEGRYDEIDPEISIKYINNLKKLRRFAAPQTIDGVMEHMWVYGPTGTGKTRRVREENPGKLYIKSPKNVWWDGYDEEEVVLIDDFDTFQVAQGGDMKRWLDRYPFQAEVKGSMSLIRPRKIIVTSNYHPSQIWSDATTVECILRRVTLVYMGAEGETEDPNLLPCVPTFFHRK